MRKFLKDVYRAWIESRRAIVAERMKTGRWE